MSDLKKLKEDAEGLSVLYVEDNEVLRKKACILLVKFFDTVYTAKDGEEGLENFKKFHPEIVLTDIQMPKMDGLELSEEIRKLSRDTKIVIMSAFDDKENLHRGIVNKVSGFLSKPVNINSLVDLLQEVVDEIVDERNKKLFLTHVENIFNYQSTMVMMLKGTQPVLVNQMFLDFFGVTDLKDFIQKNISLGNVFLEHDGFLYDKPKFNWFHELSTNAKKLYHTKIKNQKNEFRHFIVKFQNLPIETGYSVVSLDDITELNLLELFDEKQNKLDNEESDTNAIFNLFKVIQRNNATLQLHNYYKGLIITNDGAIIEVKKDSIVIKTTFLQEKAIQFERKSILTSEVIPHPIACDEIVKIGFESQSVELRKIHFLKESALQRKTVRLIPEKEIKASIFLGEKKFQGDVVVEDISLDAIRLSLNLFPAGLREGDRVIIDIVLRIDKRPVPINLNAIFFKKVEYRDSFSIVLLFEFAPRQQSILVQYITSRQITIIKEFKGLQNG